MRNIGLLFDSTGQMFTPSRGALGRGAPHRPAMVGRMSMVVATESLNRPHSFRPAVRSGWYPARKARDEWFPHAAFVAPTLAPSKLAWTSQEPRPVVTGEHHQGIIIHAVVFQRLQNLADAPVDLLYHIAIQTLA